MGSGRKSWTGRAGSRSKHRPICPAHAAASTLGALGIAALAGLAAAGCWGKSDGPQTGSESHFLKGCSTQGCCGPELECLCGACTQGCTTDTDCAHLGSGAGCIAADALPNAHECIGVSGSVCDLKCTTNADCAAHGDRNTCTKGVCRPYEPPYQAIVSGMGGPEGGWFLASFGRCESGTTKCRVLATSQHCRMEDCANPVPGDCVSLAGGTVTVRASATLEMEPTGTASYMIGLAQPLWQPGQLVRVETTGDPAGAPAFSLEAEGPEYVELLAPLTSTPPLSIPRAEPLDVRWQPGTIGEFSMGLRQLDLVINCKWPASVGIGRVPAEMMALIPYAGAASLSLGTGNKAELKNAEGRYLLGLQAYPTNTPGSQDVELR